MAEAVGQGLHLDDPVREAHNFSLASQGRRTMPSPMPLLQAIVSRVPDVRACAYGNVSAGPMDARVVITIHRPTAFITIARSPRGLGLARAWTAGDITVEGDVGYLVRHERLLTKPDVIAAAAGVSLRTIAALGIRAVVAAQPPDVEFRGRRPGRHTVASDRAEIAHHYGLSPAFYENVLGPTMIYSCGVFPTPDSRLEEAQESKHEIICRKLDLDERSTLLDIGCGWGGLLGYARTTRNCEVVGFTADPRQAATSRERLRTAGRKTTIEFGDYRNLLPRRDVTAIASVGMYEHVGASRSPTFFRLVRSSLDKGGRYLNQAIIRPDGRRSRFRRNGFAERFIFPNGEILPLAHQIRDASLADFRILSVETFGEHYSLTIERWLRNLERNWDACVEIEGEQRVRAWQIYLYGSRERFEGGALDLAQVLFEAT